MARLADAGDARSAHNRKVAGENAAAYRQIEDAAAAKTGGTVAVRPDSSVASRPYDAHTTRAELEAEYPGQVDSSTVPAVRNPNVRLRGQRHPKTGVVYDQRGLPVYDDMAVFDARIPNAAVDIADRRVHSRAATQQLDEAIRTGQVDPSRFTAEQLTAIRKHSPEIPDLTWHHHQHRGRMQLVPMSSHGDTGHAGGFSLWYRKR